MISVLNLGEDCTGNPLKCTTGTVCESSVCSKCVCVGGWVSVCVWGGAGGGECMCVC